MSFDISEYQNTIYHDPQRYDDQYWWKKNDMEFWKIIYNKMSGNQVLELGSGTGRLAIPLLKEGADYTGIEISKEFCDYAKKKIADRNLTANIINQDFRSFDFNQTYAPTDPDKVAQILDTNIFELAPTSLTRQQRINRFFRSGFFLVQKNCVLSKKHI